MKPELSPEQFRAIALYHENNSLTTPPDGESQDGKLDFHLQSNSINTVNSNVVYERIIEKMTGQQVTVDLFHERTDAAITIADPHIEQELTGQEWKNGYEEYRSEYEKGKRDFNRTGWHDTRPWHHRVAIQHGLNPDHDYDFD